MNELSNHDHSRFLTRTNHRVGRVSYAGAQAASENINTAIMREAIAIQMTWPGAPTLYYGMRQVSADLQIRITGELTRGGMKIWNF